MTVLIRVFVLLLTLKQSLTFGFASYQITLWKQTVSRRTAMFSPYTQMFTLSITEDRPYDWGLMLTGFSFQMAYYVAFRANIVHYTGANHAIRLKILEDLAIYYISFHVVLISQQSDWIWIEQTYIVPPLGQCVNGGYIETIRVATRNHQLAPGSFGAGAMITDYNAYSDNTSPIFVRLRVAQIIAPNIIQIELSSFVVGCHTIKEISYVLVYINITSLGSSTNYYFYNPAFMYTNPSSYSLFESKDTNLGIPDQFKSEQGYNGNCFVGLYQISLKPMENNSMYYNITTYPISQKLVSLTNNNTMFYQFIAYMTIICFSECRNGICADCQIPFPGCLQCNKFQCTLCQIGTYLEDGLCHCYTGELMGGYCTTISGCVQSAQLPDGSTVCLTCNATLFYSLPVNGVCQCLQGQLVNGVCCTISGCLVPQAAADGSVFCSFCDVVALFQVAPLSNGECVCIAHYELQGNQCTEVCGDGLVMGASGTACDDGNVVDGDGCSSSCAVEQFYRCENGSASSASACVYEGVPLTVSLSFAEKTEGLNQGVFQFAVYPPLINVNKMDLAQCVVLDCSAEYSVSAISYSKGVLTLTADYSTDMEGEQCTLTLHYDSTVVRSPNSSLSFTALSRNEKLIVSDHLSAYSSIKFIFRILSYAALAVFALSLPHKMIGAELLVSCQLVYLSYAFYPNPTALIGAVRGFSLVTGYRQAFFRDEYAGLMYPFSSRLSLSRQFLENTSVALSLLLLVFLLWSVFLVRSWWLSRKQQSGANLSEEEAQAIAAGQRRAKCLFDHFLFPIAVSSFLLVTISSYESSRRFDESVPSAFSEKLSSLSHLLALLMIGVVFGVEVLGTLTDRSSSRGWLSGLERTKGWYIPLFLLRLLLISLLIIAGIILSYTSLIFVIVLIMLGYSLLIVLGQPYYNFFSNLSVIISQIPYLASIILALVNEFYIFSSQAELFITFILESLISVSIITVMIRLLCHYYSILRDRSLNSTFTFPVKTQYEGCLSPQKCDFYKRRQIASHKSKKSLMNPFQRQSAPLQNSIIDQVNLRLKSRVQFKRQETEELIRLKTKLKESFLHSKRNQMTDPIDK